MMRRKFTKKCLQELDEQRLKDKKLKHNARSKLQQSVKNGRIKRHPCVVCGEPKSHGHHEDYSKPLEVIWLCARHHLDRHAYLNYKKVQDMFELSKQNKIEQIRNKIRKQHPNQTEFYFF